jgi:hypothetical protein
MIDDSMIKRLAVQCDASYLTILGIPNVLMMREENLKKFAVSCYQAGVSDSEHQRDELIAAGKALVERWDSPNWKDQEHTGVFIARLRDAIERVEK